MGVKNETEDGFVAAADLTLRQKSSLGEAGCGKDKYDLVKEYQYFPSLFFLKGDLNRNLNKCTTKKVVILIIV